MWIEIQDHLLNSDLIEAIRCDGSSVDIFKPNGDWVHYYFKSTEEAQAEYERIKALLTGEKRKSRWESLPAEKVRDFYDKIAQAEEKLKQNASKALYEEKD